MQKTIPFREHRINKNLKDYLSSGKIEVVVEVCQLRKTICFQTEVYIQNNSTIIVMQNHRLGENE